MFLTVFLPCVSVLFLSVFLSVFLTVFLPCVSVLCFCNGFEKHVVEDDGLFTNRIVAVGLSACTCVVFSA